MCVCCKLTVDQSTGQIIAHIKADSMCAWMSEKSDLQSTRGAESCPRYGKCQSQPVSRRDGDVCRRRFGIIDMVHSLAASVWLTLPQHRCGATSQENAFSWETRMLLVGVSAILYRDTGASCSGSFVSIRFLACVLLYKQTVAAVRLFFRVRLLRFEYEAARLGRFVCMSSKY